MLELQSALINIFCTPGYLILLFLGSLLGVFFGALPGLTAPMAIAVLLPMTYAMEPEIGLSFLLGVYCGTGFGCAIPAIVLNIPGTPAAVMTTIDGNAMAQKGEAEKALSISMIASSFGGLFSAFCLIFIAPHLAKVALKFGPHEYFAICFLGLCVTSGLVSESRIRGFWSVCSGVFLSTVGMDYFTNEPRFTFGITELLPGIPFIPAMIGMFAFCRVFSNIGEQSGSPYCYGLKGTYRAVLPSWSDLRRIFKSTLQGSITGTIVGILPGAGGAISAVIAYDIEKKTSPAIDADGRKFGEGRMDGLAAPEAANNAVTGGALIPLLIFGIPGDATTAIMLGSLMMYDLSPGPLFFTYHTNVALSIYISLILINVILLAIGIVGIKFFIKSLSIPQKYLNPLIIVFCVIGAYTLQNNPMHIVLMMAFGLLGILFKRYGIPQLPLILGLILGPVLEQNLRQILIINDGSVFGIFSRPISCAMMVLAIASLVAPVFRIVRGKRKLQ